MAPPTDDSMSVDGDGDGGRDAQIDLLIGDITEASKMPAKRRSTSIKPTIERAASLAYESGLLPEPLSELIDLLTRPSYLDQASLNSLLKNLYPATRLSSDCVLRIVGCLGHGELKPSLALQANILKWLIMVYHVIEKPAVLSQAYAVLFNLLDTAAIRPQLCHLLALITRRKHHPDVEWRERLDKIQRDHSQRAAEAAGQPRNGFSVNHRALKARSSKASYLPSVHTSEATENSVTLEEIDSAERLAQHIEKIELPSQLAAVLADPLLQKFVALKKDDAASKRVVHWIDAALADVLNGDADDRLFTETMEILEDYVARVKETPPVILNFFTKLFTTWNGVDARDPILSILQYAPLVTFGELYKSVLQPLERCLPPTPDSQLALLKLYQSLIRRWTFILRSMESIPSGAPVSAFYEVMEHAGVVSLNLVQASPSVAAHGAVLDLYEQAAASISDPSLQPLVRIANPPAQLIYLLFFSHSLVNVSRLCNFLATYKKGFETAMSRRQPTTYAASYVNHFNGFLMDICNCLWRGKAFNYGDKNALGCLNARAVTLRLQTYVEDLGMDLALPMLFGFSFSPLLSLQAIECIRELEDREVAADEDAISTRHAGPVTANSLARLADSGGLRITWSEYRIIVLRALESNGLGGIPALMKNTMKVLMSSKSTA
ncbi:Inner centromere protein mis6 [Colletotrichum chlorophyti]|uniref:Inner centromere protein mis6 n=1 Tax=Colletotrichum chlorophyti TaxID=708187 RepID=A0A1Q8RRD4_9PEZI|nr:Inner centromere protein mis6 [Colletotrichum chlorophyti]